MSKYPLTFGPRVGVTLRHAWEMIDVNWKMLNRASTNTQDRKARLHYMARLLENFAADMRKEAKKL